MKLRKEHPFVRLAYILNTVLAALVLLPFLAAFARELVKLPEHVSLLLTGEIEERYFRWPSMLYLLKKIPAGIGISIFVTLTGTALGSLLTLMTAYAFSSLRGGLRKTAMALLWLAYAFLPPLMPQYLLYSEALRLENTLAAYIVPNLLLPAGLVLFSAARFKRFPADILESARMDGAGEYRIFFRIVLPASGDLCALAATLLAIHYYTDFLNGRLYIPAPNLMTIPRMFDRYLYMMSSMDSTGGVRRELYEAAAHTVLVTGTYILSLLPIAILPALQKALTRAVTRASKTKLEDRRGREREGATK